MMNSTEEIKRLPEDFISGKISHEDQEALYKVINFYNPQRKIVANSFPFIYFADISLQNSGSDGQPFKGTFTEIRPDNGSKSMKYLPDSKVINLNSGSYLLYPDHFEGSNRKDQVIIQQ